ncbi:MAG: DUF4397 domain-containing protein [Planctomycetota bacterium]|jgi:hypothetical protein
MWRTSSVIIALLPVGFLAGCPSTTSPPPPPGPATVRVANAEIDGLAFDVCADGEVVLENSRFGRISEYAEVDSGTVEFVRVAAGSDCDDFINDLIGEDIDVRLEEDTDSTLVLLADGESGFQLEDDNSRTQAGRARVRTINASEDSLSLTVREEGGTVLFPLVRYNETDDYDYINVVAGTYNLVVTPLADEMTPIEFGDVEFAAGSVYTLFAVGRIGGEGEAFDMVISEDATPGVEE